MAGSYKGLGSRLGVRWRRLGVGGIVLVLLALMLPAFADTPQTGIDPSVTLTVSPSTGLADGQGVTVTGSGFPGNTVGIMRQCGGAVAAQCDLTTTTPFFTTAAGAIPPTAFAVKRIVNTGATTFNCGVQACAIVATAGAKSSQHSVRMASAGTVLTSSSTTSSVPSVSSSTTTTTAQPTSTSSTSSTSTSTSSTSSTATSTTSTVAATTTSTTSVPATGVPSTICEAMRRTVAEANADLDDLVAAFPRYRDVAVEARQATNARLSQTLAVAGC